MHHVLLVTKEKGDPIAMTKGVYSLSVVRAWLYQCLVCCVQLFLCMKCQQLCSYDYDVCLWFIHVTACTSLLVMGLVMGKGIV